MWNGNCFNVKEIDVSLTDVFMYFAWFLKNGNYFIGTFNAHGTRTKGRAWRPFNKREIAENDMSNRRAKIMLKRM